MYFSPTRFHHAYFEQVSSYFRSVSWVPALRLPVDFASAALQKPVVLLSAWVRLLGTAEVPLSPPPLASVSWGRASADPSVMLTGA